MCKIPALEMGRGTGGIPTRMRHPRAIIHDHLTAPAIQFGPPRTGSTLAWNAMRALCPEWSIPKRHTLSILQLSPFCRSKMVCTVRHPSDIIVSMLGVANAEPTPQAIANQIELLAPQGMKDVLKVRKRKDTIYLQYEEFYGDLDYLFEQLGGFLQVPATQEVREKFAEKFSISAVKQRADSLREFENFDPEDQIHGRHISKTGGKPGAYSDVLGEEDSKRIVSRFQDYCDCFGYTA